MKNATRILALVFVLAMVMTCFAGMLTTASAADTPTPNAVIDFGYAATIESISTKFECAVEAKDGYARVTVTGLDSYFVLNPTPDAPVGGTGMPGSKIDYVVIKYRTTSTTGGNFDWAYTDGTTHDDNENVGIAWNGTNDWSYTIVDASEKWGTKNEGGLYDLRFDMFDGVSGRIDVAYFKFFAEKADAEAYVAANTITGTVTGETMDADQVIFNGTTAYYVPSAYGTVTELTPVQLENVGEWASYGTGTQFISDDAVFFGTGTSVDASTTGASNALFASPIEGETQYGRGGNLGGVIKVTSAHKYIRIYGWSTQASPAVKYGYQLGNNAPVLEERFLFNEDPGAPWAGPNGVRFCITVPLTELEAGKAYAVQFLVEHENGTVSTLSSAFKNFRVASEVEYDYTDAQGNGYAVDGNRLISGGEEYKLFTNGEKYWAVQSDVIVPVAAEGAPTDQPANLYTDKPANANGTNVSLDAIEDGGTPSGAANEGAEGVIAWNGKDGYSHVNDWLQANDPFDLSKVTTSLSLEGWVRGSLTKVGYIIDGIDGDVRNIKWTGDFYYDESLAAVSGNTWSENAHRYMVYVYPADIPDGYHTIEPVCKVEGDDNIYTLGWSTFYVLKGEANSRYTFSDYTYSYVAAPVEKAACTHENTKDTIVSAATCTKAGSKDVLCLDCGYVQNGVEIKALGHTEETVKGYAATCTETGLTDGVKCAKCGETITAQTEIKALGHTVETIQGKAASCTEDGLTAGEKCSVCKEILKAQETITASGHTEETVKGYDATCTETGLTDGKECTTCWQTTVEQEEIPATGHTEEIIPAVDPTATTPGLTEGKKCSDCGEVIVEQVEIPALGGGEETCTHANTQDANVVAATCGAAGSKDVRCLDCGYVQNGVEIPATGEHDYANPVDGETISEATCTEDKVIYWVYTCTVCDDKKYQPTSQTGTATGHSYDAGVYTEPTFEADGYTTFTCVNNCGDSYTKTDTGTMKIAQVEVNGVKYETLEAAVAAAQAGDTVKLLADLYYDVKKANDFIVMTGLTLDMNGKTIYSRLDALWFSGENFTITNGTFDGRSASYGLLIGTDYDLEKMDGIVNKNIVIDGVTVKGGILLCNVSDVTIKNCTVNADVEGDANDYYAIWADNYVSNITIESGSFTTASGKKPVNNYSGNPTGNPITVTGGTFSEKIEDQYCADGYIQVENEDGSFTAKVCTHDWAAATCTVAKTCKVCGATEGEALGHAWTDATCSAPKTCSVCGATEGEATGIHTPGAAATCTTAQKCVYCDYVFKPAKGHDYNITHVGATCTTYAYDVYECKNCDYKIDKANIGNEYAAHTPNVAAPTCTQNKYCTVCNTELAPELGHNYKTVVTAPTCTEQGYTTYTCANCGDVKVADYVAATGHTEKALAAVAPDCVNTGLTEGKICTVCGETLVAQETVAALGHTEVIVPGTAATCLEGGISDGAYCSVCGETTVAQEEIAALGHTEETIPAVNATCVADGKTAGVKCAVCGEILAAQQIVPATGHSNVTVPGYAATCTEAGLTAGTKCSVCNEVIVAQTAIAPTGHSTVVLPAVGATCTETGLTEGRQCTVCGTITVKQETTPVIPHTQETIAAVAPTCTATGLTEGKKCIVCGTVTVEQQTVAALGHVEETVPGAAASCTEAGMTDGKKCSVCGEITVAQEEIPAAGHTEEIIPAVDATYESTGLTEGKKCSVCGEILVAQVVTDKLPAKGDDTVEEEETTKAPETTEAPATDAPATEAPVTSDEATTEAKGGCGSVIGMSAAAVVLAAAAAAVALKKKED